MAHKPYNLYKRRTKKPGKYIYYCQFYNESGNRMTAKSTGETSKAAAETWAIEQIKNGRIITKKNITFGQFANDWWIYDKCRYIKGKLARGMSISRSYADSMRIKLTKYILPYFVNIKLSNITPKMIEDWLMELKEKPGRYSDSLTATTINRCYTTLKIMIKEAIRLGYLNSNPAFFLGPMKEKPKEKSILTCDEVKRLFQDDTINQVWDGDLMHYTLNLLAASTGMRVGEVQALKIQNIHREYISIVHSYDRKYGLKSTKSGHIREIPMPSKTSEYLQELISLSPYKEIDDFMFWGIERSVPIYYKKIRDSLYDAFQRIGITPEERKERNVTFHSWRHFYNSLMRGKIHDSKLRRLTGHKTLEMTEHYTHFNLADFKDVLTIQEEYFA